MIRHSITEQKLRSFTKICSKCKQEKEKNSFSKSRSKFDGLSCYCKDCSKKRIEELDGQTKQKYNEYKKQWRKDNYRHRKNLELKYNYNITLEIYEDMLTAQNNCCAICNTNQTDCDRRFCVDHCHKTGVVRGLLCGNCNTGLGKFKDKIDLLDKASLYLKKSVKEK